MFTRAVLLLLFPFTAAIADECKQPTAAPAVPDGATADQETMIAASQDVRRFVSEGQAYTDCMQPVIDAAKQDAVAADEGSDAQSAANQALQNAVGKHDQMVSEMQSLADNFNSQLRAYRASQE